MILSQETCNSLHPILSQLRSHLENLYGDRLVHLILFGSQARGEATPDSDIDILIVLKGTVNIGEEIQRTSPIIATLSLNYNIVLSRLFMNQETFTKKSSPLLRNIRQEGILF
ncbi:MAG: nucleotidyltransferase domain-containing protein [Kamptonema sp. SIO4C4]|nr:nucleotidyltransferase domain-containing protein [Kamptonema sp. SIO4C4]